MPLFFSAAAQALAAAALKKSERKHNGVTCPGRLHGGVMANRFRVIFLLFLSFFSFNSFSAIPTVKSYFSTRYPDLGVLYSIDDACNAAGSIFEGYLNEYNHSATSSVLKCTVYYYLNASNPRSTGLISFSINSSACPLNSYKSGSQCICNEGYEEKDGNSCEKPKEPDACENIAQTCSGLAGQKLSRFEVYYSGSVPSSACSNPPIEGCSQGCTLHFTGIGVGYKDSDGRSVYSSPAVIAPGPCIPSDVGSDGDNPDPEKSCKVGEFPGTVNGTKVCLPAKSKETEHKTTEKENADGSKSESKTTTTCENGVCTSTTTTTEKDASGNTTGTSSSSTTRPESDFCARNPGNPLCSDGGDKGGGGGSGGSGSGGEGGEGEGGSGSFGGSCSSGFECEGDAATCAIAKEQHRVNCELSDTNNPLSQLFNESKGTGFGVDEFDFDLSTQLNFDPVIGSGSCPADVEITVFGQSITVKLSDYCPYFAILGNLLILGATIGCFRILGSA